jgi:hypothetical protein
MTNLVQLRLACNLLFLGRLDPILLLRKVLVALLLNRVTSGGRVMSLRTLLIRLTPCFLSTVLSVYRAESQR